MSLLAAGRITVTFSTLYAFTFVNGLIHKKIYARRAAAKGIPFDRYNAPEMRPHDRLSMNLLEWSPVFLGPLWSLAATDTLDSISIAVAWTYVGLRALYFALMLKYGVHASGMNQGLWAATMPGYVCLVFLLARGIVVLFK